MHTAHLLLQKVLEFMVMTPDDVNWYYDNLRHNKPREVRYRQIEALMKAFLLDDDGQDLAKIIYSPYAGEHHSIIRSFLGGNFIRVRDVQLYAKEWQYIMEYATERTGKRLKEHELSNQLVAYQFYDLMGYRRKLYEVMAFPSVRRIAAEVASFQYNILITETINKNLEGKDKELDEALCRLIDPKQRSYSMDELVTRFNYPTENLSEIDSEFEKNLLAD